MANLNIDLEAKSIEEILERIVEAGFDLSIASRKDGVGKYYVSIEKDKESASCYGDDLKMCIAKSLDEVGLKLTDSESDLVVLNGEEKITVKRLSAYEKLMLLHDAKGYIVFAIDYKLYSCIGPLLCENDKNLYYMAYRIGK